MSAGELFRQGRHRVAEFDGKEDLDIGAETEQFAESGVVGVEPERSFDPVGSVALRRVGDRPRSPAFRLAVHQRDLQGTRLLDVLLRIGFRASLRVPIPGEAGVEVRTDGRR